ncbi:MFS transporter [Kibdelosporangium persicum]|uniref:Major facilitator sugar transporter n=1 Tax=Kibdelosporangium persicum TaxID=2698649 RepID=A0ABX2FF84_9PSEU|nr:MFS transporter [Kibdelosporangium persicum]NRN70046.1 Major facilitator sugar transporter [Kibdelosporangium persicum]
MTTPVGTKWIGALSLATFGMSIAVLTPIQVLLPLQIEAIDPAGKVLALGWITAAAAVVSIVVCPVAGALSDRTTSRFGRRRPWVLGSGLMCCAALIALGAQDTILGVALLWITVQAATNALYAALTAAVPDQVPVHQRGVVSAFVGLPLPLSLIVGTFIVSTVVTGQFAAYLTLALAELAFILPFVLHPADKPVTRQVSRPRFRLHADLVWAFGCRFAIQIANAVGTLYLLYYLRDVVHRPDPAKSVFLLILIYTAGVVPASVVAGRWSDRSGRRKPFVIVSSVVVAAAMLVLGLGNTWPSALVAAILMGVGYGVYLAVDNALITQVLPSDADRGRDLGLVNIANTAPQAVAPALAGIVITSFGGYTPLYLLAGACGLIGAALIQPVRSVR